MYIFEIDRQMEILEAAAAMSVKFSQRPLSTWQAFHISDRLSGNVMILASSCDSPAKGVRKQHQGKVKIFVGCLLFNRDQMLMLIVAVMRAIAARNIQSISKGTQIESSIKCISHGRAAARRFNLLWERYSFEREGVCRRRPYLSPTCIHSIFDHMQMYEAPDSQYTTIISAQTVPPDRRKCEQ